MRAEHIALEVDVPRSTLLKQIDVGFEETNVVLIHAASGQGKTTLAYRYLLDSAPTQFRLELLPAANLQHARRLVAAFTAHSEAVSVPTIVYLDVRPGDELWTEIVRELAAVPRIHILVTIREDDLSRASVTQADFIHSPINLEFTEVEAKQIYDRIVSGPNSEFLGFDDAWAKFGTRKTLFEFVFFITQEELLTERISEQIRRLQNEVNQGKRSAGELKLLRLAAVASIYEARLELRPLAKHCDIPEPARTVELFENEFLIRQSDTPGYVEGFHAIRSSMVCDQLLDEVLSPWADYAAECLPFMAESDLGHFLLAAFSRRPEATTRLVETVQELNLSTWSGIWSVFISLRWLGLRQYIDANRELLNEVVARFQDGWTVILDWDWTGLLDGGLDLKNRLPADGLDFVEDARGRQTEKNAVLDLVQYWAKDRTLPSPPETVDDFVAFTEVAFWLGHFQLDSKFPAIICEELVSQALLKLPIHLFGEFAMAARSCAPEFYSQWLTSNHHDLLRAVCENADIVALVEEESRYVIHFVIDIDAKASILRPSSSKRDKRVDEVINHLAVERVQLIRQCFEEKATYASCGYGHIHALIHQHDDSAKDIAIANLVMPSLTRFNVQARNLVDYDYRPETWDDYFRRLAQFLGAVQSLPDAIQTGMKQDAAKAVAGGPIQECKSHIEKHIPFPKPGVDEWGYTSVSSESEAWTLSQRYIATDRMLPLTTAIRSFRSSIENFIKQACESLMLVPHLKDKTYEEIAALESAAAGLGLNPNSMHLSVVNGLIACSEVKKVISALSVQDLPQFPANSFSPFSSSLRKMMHNWCQFTHPNQVGQPSGKKKRQKQSDLADVLKPSRNRIRSALIALKGCTTRIYSETATLDDQPALWLTFDVNHPLDIPMLQELVWNEIRRALEPDQNKIVRLRCFELFWKTLAIVVLVGGKRVTQNAIVTDIVFATSDDDLSRGFPFQQKAISDTTWRELGIASWPANASLQKLDRFLFAYGELYSHLDHMSDFGRCVTVEELGFEVFNRYIRREAQRANTQYQALIDNLKEILGHLNHLETKDWQSRPNLAQAVQYLTSIEDALWPVKGFSGTAQVQLYEVVAWRDRMLNGFEAIEAARLYWTADVYDFPFLTPIDD